MGNGYIGRGICQTNIALHDKKAENEIKHKSVIPTATLMQYSITFALLYAISDILIAIFGVNVEGYSLGDT